VATKFLIVNADDFGQTRGLNGGIIEAHQNGIVTSASLMVRWPAAAEAASYAGRHPRLSLGLHVDLGEWAFDGGAWVTLYDVVQTEDASAVAAEIARQFAAFQRLTGKQPTHVDSHQHVHNEEPARSILIEICRKLAIPLRHHSPEIHYCGSFYGQTSEGFPDPQAISVDALLKILATLKPGVTELGCHPGDASDLDTMYRNERGDEMKVLCDPRIRAAIDGHGIELRGFHDLLTRATNAGTCKEWETS
jgi:chitin disaccharide deacetylase